MYYIRLDKTVDGASQLASNIKDYPPIMEAQDAMVAALDARRLSQEKLIMIIMIIMIIVVIVIKLRTNTNY